MANVKSVMNSKGKRRKKKKHAATAMAESGAPARAARHHGGGASLEQLELAVDRCLHTARGMEEKDPELHEVSRALRNARNRIVWILGKS
jgi:hypothetical protein